MPAETPKMRLMFAAFALMIGNFTTALAVLAPAGMLNDLAADFALSVQQTGWLVTSGAIVLCIGSPLMAWVSSTFDRRRLLVTTLALLAVGFAACAAAPGFATLFAVRLVMLFVAAVFTPQAAGTVALITTEKTRAGAISFIFLGWSLAVAAGLPLVTLIAANAGWRISFWLLSGCAGMAALLTWFALPSGVRGVPLSSHSWGRIARSGPILRLLGLTALFIAGQFMIFLYLAPLLAILARATPPTIAATFAIMGGAGLAGNVIASRAVGWLGPYRVSVACVVALLAGAIVWTTGTGALAPMATGVALLGFGSFALNSMQQARLVATAPDLAGGTVALNTSLLYVGQAVGSFIAGLLIDGARAHLVGVMSILFLAASLMLLLATRPRS
jgi:predicted MFS family arabinose efflux permease